MSYVSQYIEQYGKELITDMLDMLVINNKPNNNVIYDLLVKHKVITRRTKYIRTFCYKQDNNKGLRVTINNASGKRVFHMSLFDNDMTEMLSALSA